MWLRFGADQKSAHWTYKNEYRTQFSDTLLSPEDMNVIEHVNFTDACVVTDLKLKVQMTFGWHPSFLRTYDVTTRQSEVLIFNRNRQCTMNTTLRFAKKRQGLWCTGGTENACGLHSLPYANQESGTTFLEHVTFDPAAENSMMCPKPGLVVNAYTFFGSYYYAYIKMASCPPPTGSFGK